MFRFVGDGFLYNMVRILVGTILEVGRGYRSADEMQEILTALDRSRAGKTAPPHALYLWEVHYENDQ
jgi:tRNA pseudouridine38-40 synthase